MDRTQHSQPILGIQITKPISSALYNIGQLRISILTQFDNQLQKVGRCLCWPSGFQGPALNLTQHSQPILSIQITKPIFSALYTRGYHSGRFDVQFVKRFGFRFEWISQNASRGVLEFHVDFDFDSLSPSTAFVADSQISLKRVIITNGTTFCFL